ncbi:hypothetical protein MLD38_009310 [Melastoma candidum]|uniref:Uncharacterized protein n=1 Tax=Melastoma candidum TaxID=119954 RepID=A0ACB9RWA4_9MYRT|nr:hypothetical protein MLD38_009310 [Melastoma candidum]
MALCCFSFTSTRNKCLRLSFSFSGLRPTLVDLHDGTFIHTWIPKKPDPAKPNLVFLHGVGANAMWQWNDFFPCFTSRYNVYIPDLLFFGDSYTSRPDRSDSFQARCVAATMEANGVKKMSVVGMSYGGFVAYQISAQYPERIEKLVLICAGVCMEEEDMDRGLFGVASVDDAVSVLLPQTPDKVRDLIRFTFHKPPKRNLPSCFLKDFINVMCKEYLQEKTELIHALHKDRKLSNLPKLAQSPLIIWGEYDRVFPMELAHRLQRHVGEDAKVVVLKDAGHAINVEKPKEMLKHMKSFLLDPPPKQPDHSNGQKQNKS